MSNVNRLRASRELFLAAFGVPSLSIESWVMDRVTSLLQPGDVKAGSVVFESGDPPDWLYFMREGGVRLSRKGIPDQVLQGPRVLGMFDALLDRPRPCTAVALVDNQLMKVRVEDWLELLDDSFELARTAILRLGREVAHLEESELSRSGAIPRAMQSPIAWSPNSSSPAERLGALMEVGVLRDGGVQTLSDLALLSEAHHFDEGQVLFESGARSTCVFLVVTGAVESRRERPDLVRCDGPGTVVSGPASFTEPRNAWKARAISETWTLAFRIEDWFDLMEENFDLVRAALAGLARQHEALTQLDSAGPGTAR